MDNEMVVDAVTRNFEIIGEAASRMDSDFKDKNPDIEWIRITGFRTRIIHEYFGIDYDIMWSIIADYLPELIRRIKKVIP